MMLHAWVIPLFLMFAKQHLIPSITFCFPVEFSREEDAGSDIG